MGSQLASDAKSMLSITEHEVEQARLFRAQVEEARGPESSDGTYGVMVDLPNGVSVEMPAQLAGVVRHVLDVVSNGGTVTVGAVPSELTTTTAAKMLGISRPTLMKLIGDGKIPAHKVGSHARLLSKDVFAFRDARLQQQRDAFDDLRRFEDELGLDG
ncbi:excisionase family DNA-binding protein [Rhodococcus triatomae]